MTMSSILALQLTVKKNALKPVSESVQAQNMPLLREGMMHALREVPADIHIYTHILKISMISMINSNISKTYIYNIHIAVQWIQK